MQPCYVDQMLSVYISIAGRFNILTYVYDCSHMIAIIIITTTIAS